MINCVVVSNALKSVHSVFSGCFSWLDAITMPSGLDAAALGARKRACGRALAASLAASGYRRAELWLPDSPCRAAPACCRCCALLLPSVSRHDNAAAAAVASLRCAAPLARLDATRTRTNRRRHAIYDTTVRGPRRPRVRAIG